MTTLSVVVPNYNHARHLPRALDAILGQSRPADEVIVVDDGSTDESMAVLDGYADRHRRVTVIAHDQNSGVVAALKTGLAKATGTYLYMAAADDEVLPGFFALGLEQLEGRPELGLFTGCTVLKEAPRGRPLGMRPAVWPRYSPGPVSPQRAADLLRRSDNWILTGASLMLRDAVDEAGGLRVDLGSFADGFLARKIALKRGFYFHPTPVAIWNVHEGSLSRRTATQPAEAARVLEECTDAIHGDPVFPVGYAKQFANRWRFATARIALSLPAEDRAVIEALAVQGPLDRQVLVRLAPRFPGRLSRFASLGWLYLRLSPTTLRGVVASWVAARLWHYSRGAARSQPRGGP